jgi:PAS domain S-box-containing protein
LVNRSTIEELFNHRQRKRVINYYQNIASKQAKATQFIFQCSNGKERIVELNIRSIDDNNLLHATINDITENIIYEKRIQELVDQISVINEIVAAVNSNLNKNQLIQVFFNQIGKIFRYDLACMLLCDIEDRELEIHLSKDPSEIESRKAIGLFCQSLAKALLSCNQIEQDATAISNVADVVGLQLEEKYNSQILIQLEADEQLIGTVMLFSCKENALTQFHVDIFQEISGQIATAFMKSRLLHRYQQSLTNLSFLAKINESLSSSLDLDVVLKLLVESSQQIIQAKICTIHFLRRVDKSNENTAWSFEDKLIDLFKPQIQQVILNQRLLIVENVDYNSIQFFKNRIDIQKLNLKSLIILPVIVDGKTIALLSVFLDKIHYFSEHEIEFLSMLADQAAIAIRNAELYKQVEQSKNFLESIIHSSTHIIVSTDLAGNATFFNHSACRNTGYSDDEVINLPFFERFIKNGHTLFEGLKHELLTRKKPQSFECEIFGKNGQSSRIAWSFAPLIDQQNEIIGTLGIGREISKQKRMKGNISLASNLNFS